MRAAFLIGVVAALVVALPASAAPGNDNLSDATVIESFPYEIDTSNEGATRELAEGQAAGCGGSYGSTLWWRFTATTDQRVLVEVDGDHERPAAIWRGPNATQSEQCGAGGRTVFEARAGETYYIQVGEHTGGDEGELELEVLLDGGIKGTASLESRASLPPDGIWVQTYTSKNRKRYQSACTTEDGTYHITGMEPGKYKVRFGFGCEDEPDAGPHEWFPDVPRFACATAVEVVPGTDVEDIDAELDRSDGASTPCPKEQEGSTPTRRAPATGTPGGSEPKPERSPDEIAVEGDVRVDPVSRPSRRARDSVLVLAGAALGAAATLIARRGMRALGTAPAGTVEELGEEPPIPPEDESSAPEDDDDVGFDDEAPTIGGSWPEEPPR